jgi:hypothetical protein
VDFFQIGDALAVVPCRYQDLSQSPRCMYFMHGMTFKIETEETEILSETCSFFPSHLLLKKFGYATSGRAAVAFLRQLV